MRFSVKLDESNPLISEALLREVKQTWQAAAANRFATIVHRNFGQTGEDRPTQWPSLSKDYANEFHGGSRIPTLFLTGELQQSVQIQDTNIEYSEVFTENEYAEAHQWGEGNLPARPFFPMNEEGELTTYSEWEVLRAGQEAVDKLVGNMGRFE